MLWGGGGNHQSHLLGIECASFSDLKRVKPQVRPSVGTFGSNIWIPVRLWGKKKKQKELILQMLCASERQPEQIGSVNLKAGRLRLPALLDVGRCHSWSLHTEESSSASSQTPGSLPSPTLCRASLRLNEAVFGLVCAFHHLILSPQWLHFLPWHWGDGWSR